MKNVNLKQEIIQIIEDNLRDSITEEMLVMELFLTGIDSIKIIQIIVDIEEKYNVKLGKMFEDDTLFANLQAFIDNVSSEVMVVLSQEGR